MINSPFNEIPICYAYNDERNEAPSYLPYDYVFKSLEPLDCGEGNLIEYDTLPSHLPFPLVHHLDSYSSNSLVSFDMTLSDHAPFPPSEYGVKKEPFVEYTLPPLTHP